MAATSADGAAVRTLPDRIGGRYAVQSELGRGGLATVYRVTDSVSGRELALKQLTLTGTAASLREQGAAFEREFHSLAQLSHPRIIEVYDFGNDERGRYYTMELLDGSDLRQRAPLPWREACRLMHDVCSSLALLHSRGLVHRDISPRNIRTCEGRAKLIDFGALVPMGTTAQIVGTPPFLPPEVLHRSTLDGRTDLFSLGATLYYTLTGQFAFPARDFSRLHEAWASRPAPPSSCVADVPAALDALVMALIALDPELRPRTAFDVMQRLAGIAAIPQSEVDEVSRAYVSTPMMVGREAALAVLRERTALAFGGKRNGVFIRGPAGIGRSRMLDAGALEAKIAGATVLRVNAGSGNDEALGVARALAAQLVEAQPVLALTCARDARAAEVLFEKDAAGDASEAAPRLKHWVGHGRDSGTLLAALARWLLRVAAEHPMAVLIDDVNRVDESSLALLAALVLARAPSTRLLLLATAESELPVAAGSSFGVLQRECLSLELPALTREQTEALLGSVFGDVPHLGLVSDRLFAAAAGNPRETMELVQALIARESARYARGRWMLPATLDAGDLPDTATESWRQRVAALSPLARRLAEVHAVAVQKALVREDYALAAGTSSAAELDAAITELLAQRVLASDGRTYVLARREWANALKLGLGAGGLAERHRLLAEIYAKDDALALERAHHLLAAGLEAAGVELVGRLLAATRNESQGVLTLTTMSVEQVAQILEGALTSAERLQRSPREVNEIRRGVCAISLLTDEARYLRAAPAWFAQLSRDSGLSDYLAIGDDVAPQERLMRALTQASQRYAATPEAERVHDPEAAIKGLVYYTAVSIAIASRTQDSALLAALPAVLEPFAVLSPLIHAMWQNAIATRETARDSLPEHAHRRWLQVDAVLATVSSTELSYLEALRGAIAYGVGLIEARLGFADADARARALEADPLQRVSGAILRRIVRLHKGDFEGAEHFRKHAELLALQANQAQMFRSTLTAEVIAHALASNLTGIREVMDALEPLAARFRGWRGYKYLAQGYFEQLQGREDAALAAFERGIAVSEPDPADPQRCFGTWPRLEAAYIEALAAAGRAEQAKARGERVLQQCAEHRIDVGALCIQRALALAEAKLGDYAGASRRLENVIRQLEALTVTGLEMGATCEARTRVAIWAGDHDAVERYGRLTAKSYRHGERSALGARYERLMDDARASGVSALPQLGDVALKSAVVTRQVVESRTSSTRLLTGLQSTAERAERAIALLCQAHGATSGHLYLSRRAGLVLASSRGPGVASPELEALVSRYLEDQQNADEQKTVIESASVLQQATCWLDAHGASFRFSLLVDDAAGAPRFAGVAVIEHGEQSAAEREAALRLAGELAAELLRWGDADEG